MKLIGLNALTEIHRVSGLERNAKYDIKRVYEWYANSEMHSVSRIDWKSKRWNI